MVREGAGFDRPNPATAIAGGEGGGAWEVQQAKVHQWVAWEVEGRTGARASTASGGCWSSGSGGDVVPVGIGRGGGVGELRQDTAELLVRSSEGEEGRRRGFDGEVELAGVRAERRRCSRAWKRGKGERALGLACWGTCSAHARERRERRALPRAVHGGGEVAAGG